MTEDVTVEFHLLKKIDLHVGRKYQAQIVFATLAIPLWTYQLRSSIVDEEVGHVSKDLMRTRASGVQYTSENIRKIVVL
jgi:hypothetical protein